MAEPEPRGTAEPELLARENASEDAVGIRLESVDLNESQVPQRQESGKVYIIRSYPTASLVAYLIRLVYCLKLTYVLLKSNHTMYKARLVKVLDLLYTECLSGNMIVVFQMTHLSMVQYWTRRLRPLTLKPLPSAMMLYWQ